MSSHSEVCTERDNDELGTGALLQMTFHVLMLDIKIPAHDTNKNNIVNS